MADSNLPKTVLVIDNDQTVARGLSTQFKRHGIEVLAAVDLDSAFYIFNNQQIDCVLIENGFEGMIAVSMIQKFRLNPDIQKRSAGFVVISGQIRPMAVDNMLKELMDVETLIKPFSEIQVLPCVSRSYVASQRLLKYEKYKLGIMEMVDKGQGSEAFMKINSEIKSIGRRGVLLGVDVLTHMKQYDTGLKFIEGFLKQDPSNTLYLLAKAKLCARTGKNKEAELLFDQTYTQSPLNTERLGEMANNYVALGEPEKAMEKMKELLTLSPDDKEMKFKMFKMLHEKGMREQLGGLAKKTSQPLDVIRYYNNSGVELSKRGDYAAAIKEYETVVQIYPDHPEMYRIYYNLALAYKKANVENHEVKMDAALKKAIEIKPDFAKAKEAMRPGNSKLKESA